MFRKKTRKKTSRHRTLKFLLVGLVLGIAIGMASVDAKELYGDSTHMPYPLSVGDTFIHNGKACITAYAWSDDSSAVALCHTREGNTVIEHDQNADSWNHWNGCIRFNRKGYRLVGRTHSTHKCFGPSLLDIGKDN